MESLFHHIGRPVKRVHSEYYLRQILISFVISVIGTRLFLQLAGYPQIGNGSIHVAHVLWGGFFLFFAALIPIVFANRWSYSVGSVLTGVGTGLFVDELGKFVTQTNNYFYPPAMPLIYGIFLILLIVYMRFRSKPTNDTRYELYRALDALSEVIDSDLDKTEYKELRQTLRSVIKNGKDKNQVKLAKALLSYLRADTLDFVPTEPSTWANLFHKVRQVEEKRGGRRLYKAVIIGILIASGIFAFTDLVLLARLTLSPSFLQEYVSQVFIYGQALSHRQTTWLLVRLALEGLVGVFFLVAARFILLGKERRGLAIANYGLLIALTMLNLLEFYFDQLRAVVGTAGNFGILFLINFYRNQYVFTSYREKKPAAIASK